MTRDLIEGFDPDALCAFLNAKFSGSLSRASSALPEGREFGWAGAEKLGVVKTVPGPNGANRPLLVVVARLADGQELKERSSRVRQFKFAKKVLDQAMGNPAPGVDGVLSQGIFVFHDEHGNFRLSLVYGQAEGTRLRWSTAKRLSFHVQAGHPNKTFRSRSDLPWNTFDKLQDAFSVEKLTKEFYNRLFAWYEAAMESDEVVFPNDLVKDKEAGQVKSEQIIRLITRLMFVWFLKQKHLVPDELFDPARLKTILRDFHPGKGDNYYRAILQNLFFATLNSDINDREFAVEGSRAENEEHFGVKILYRYAADFLLSEKQILKLFGTIPFLNGGLFECLDRDKQYFDGFSRNRVKQARVPNRLLFDEAAGLIPLLEQYNFTVEENSPGDEEVALDPELLGKVFENLLAAYNPETNEIARNATGSFYTPREIVNYMVDESLIAMLTTRCGEEHEQVIRALFSEGTRPDKGKLCEQMDQALRKAKILDPACGSGAFPMGVLLRMVDLLRVLRALPDNVSVYDLKLELIENCIYGADIQCIAVQIAKLRFFISLVCEQKPTDDSKRNFGINTLPNLETKFVAADSLIGLAKPEKRSAHGRLEKQADLFSEEEDPDIKRQKAALWKVRHEHFLARSYPEKKELRAKDKKLRDQLTETLRSKEGYTMDAAKRMASWDPYDQNTSSPFCDAEWMFNVRAGFDVVIGNPPYIQLQANKGRLADVYENCGYKTFGRTADVYCLFYERGFSLLSNLGYLCYITSNQWMRTSYGAQLREYFSQETRPLKLLDMGEGVFEATTNTNIILIQKSTPASYLKALSVKDKSILADHNAQNWIDIAPIRGTWVVGCGNARRIFEKMNRIGKSLKNWDVQINRGILTGFNAGFIISGSVRAELIKRDSKSKDIIRPLLEGSDIKRYVTFPDDLWLLNTHNGSRITAAVDIRNYPAIKKHLDEMEKKRAAGEFGEKAKKAKGLLRREDQGRTPYNLRNCAYLKEFDCAKISWGNLCQSAQFAIVEPGVYINAPATFITPASHYLLGILNSRLGDFYVRSLGVIRSGGYFEYKPMFIEQLPVPQVPLSQQKPIADVVTRVLARKKENPTADIRSLEAQIDMLVYKLYGLTDEEIDVVEGSVPLSIACESPSIPVAGTGKAKAVPVTGTRPRGRKAKPALPPSLPGWD